MEKNKKIFKEAEKLIKDFGSDAHNGLSEEGVKRNREKYGKNEITPSEKVPVWKQFLEHFKDPTIIILCICALVSTAIGIYQGEFPWDGIGIFIAIIIATGVGFWSEYKADKAFETLKEDNENIDVKVIRDGSLKVISTKELVVGDIIELENGDKIPADAVVLNCIDLLVDESLMTGESVPVEKGPDNTKLIGGTMVVTGSARAVVTNVGDNMEMGSILRSLADQTQEQTPLQYKLAKLAGLISVVGTVAAVLIFFALFANSVLTGNFGVLSNSVKTGTVVFLAAIAVITGVLLIKGNKKIKRIAAVLGPLIAAIGLLYVAFAIGKPADAIESAKSILDFFIVAVTIIVVAVPEGLPMAVTISLALSMRKIRRDNNLVRKMLATETIGSVNVICSDKTGTLTKNQMQVRDVYFNGKHFDSSNFNELTQNPMFEVIKILLAANSTANVTKDKDGNIEIVGNTTEGAMLTWLNELGVNFNTILDIRENMPVYDRLSFNADRKMMSTVTGLENSDLFNFNENKDKDSQTIKSCKVVLAKGAPERILSLCTGVSIGDKIESFEKHKDDINNKLLGLSDKAMRTIALAYKVVAEDEVLDKDSIEKDLVFAGLLGITDPVREDVPHAINVAKEAGINVIMVTGDNVNTARAIAREINLLEEDSIVMEGSEFKEKSDEEILSILKKLRVLARATPSDKERLVSLIQRTKEVVAVTGDGTNDAPALKKADVGISMGLKGTDVAKEASDIVLTDDNFGSIVKAVHWGRTLYENVQKFLQFQLTINVSALAIAFLSPILGMIFPSANFQTIPLTVLQLLWINLVMDTLAALALGLEPPRDGIMKEKPKRREESFLTKNMSFSILTTGLYFTVFILLLQAFDFMGASKLGDKGTSSVLFTTYVFMQLFNLLNSRSLKPGASIFENLTKSKSFMAIFTVIVVVQVIITQFGGAFFNTQALPLYMWGKIILVSSLTLVVGALVRWSQKLFIKN